MGYTIHYQGLVFKGIEYEVLDFELLWQITCAINSDSSALMGGNEPFPWRLATSFIVLMENWLAAITSKTGIVNDLLVGNYIIVLLHWGKLVCCQIANQYFPLTFVPPPTHFPSGVAIVWRVRRWTKKWSGDVWRRPFPPPRHCPGHRTRTRWPTEEGDRQELVTPPPALRGRVLTLVCTSTVLQEQPSLVSE